MKTRTTAFIIMLNFEENVSPLGQKGNMIIIIITIIPLIFTIRYIITNHVIM